MKRIGRLPLVTGAAGKGMGRSIALAAARGRLGSGFAPPEGAARWRGVKRARLVGMIWRYDPGN